MRISRRRLTRGQILIAGVAGVLGGVYIWKPVFEAGYRRQLEEKQKQLAASSESGDAETLKNE